MCLFLADAWWPGSSAGPGNVWKVQPCLLSGDKILLYFVALSSFFYRGRQTSNTLSLQIWPVFLCGPCW